MTPTDLPGFRVDGLAAEMGSLLARLSAMGLGPHAQALVGLARPCAYGIVVPASLVGDPTSAMAPSGHGSDAGVAGDVFRVDLSTVPEAGRIGLPEVGVIRLSAGPARPGSGVRHLATYSEAPVDAGPAPVREDGEGVLAFVLRLDPMPDALDALMRSGGVTEVQRDAYDELCCVAAFPPGAALKLGGHCLASGVPAGFAAAAREGTGRPTMRDALRWGNLATVAPPWADMAPGCVGDALTVACLREAMAGGELSGTHAQFDGFTPPPALASPRSP